MMKPEQIQIIATVTILQRRIDNLNEEIDALLEPLVNSIAATNDIVQITELIHQLPSGFHRSELRTIVNVLTEDRKVKR